MSHIAVTAIPYGGHVNPTLAVVAELVSRGHRVSYATTEEFRDRVRDVGASWIPYRTSMKSERVPLVPFDDPDHYSTADLARLLRVLLTEAVDALPQLARAYAGDRPDLVLHDTSSWAGEILAARLGVPSVASQVMLASGEHWVLNGGLDSFDRDDAELRAVAVGVDRLVRRSGVAVDVRALCAGRSADPMLVYLPRAFQPHGDRFPPSVHFVGPCLGERGFHGRWRPPSRDAPVVLVALGSTFNAPPEFYRTCVAAFAGTPWHAVIALGEHVDPAVLGPLPANVEAHRYVAQLDVLAAATAFVSHAGMGSTMESLALGVPLVAVPQMAEQRVNADRLVEMGLGVRLATDGLTPEGVRHAVTGVASDPEVRARIGAMQKEIQAAGGAPEAADHIEHYLRRDRA